MTTLRSTFALLVRDARLMLDVTQRELAAAVGVSRAHIASVESGRCNPSLDLVQRISDQLGLDIDFAVRMPHVLAPPLRDLVHAWCMAYVERRLKGAGFAVRREVEIVVGRSHAWIDLIAFDPRTRTLFVIEVKTRVDDLGSLERQVSWYEREAWAVARRFGWTPLRVVTWVLALCATRSPRAVSFLLADFKGGTAFDPLLAGSDRSPRRSEPGLAAIREGVAAGRRVDGRGRRPSRCRPASVGRGSQSLQIFDLLQDAGRRPSHFGAGRGRGERPQQRGRLGIPVHLREHLRIQEHVVFAARRERPGALGCLEMARKGANVRGDRIRVQAHGRPIGEDHGARGSSGSLQLMPQRGERDGK